MSNKFLKILNKYKERFKSNSQIKIDEKYPDEITIIIPTTDWSKEGYKGCVECLIFFGLFFTIPLWLGLRFLDTKGFAQNPMDLVLILIGLIPFYFIVDLWFSLARYVFFGFQKIYINKSRKTVLFYDSFCFKFLNFYLEKPNEKESGVENTHIELKCPIRIFGIPIEKNERLFLIMHGKRIKISTYRSNMDRRRVHGFIKKYL